jgi:choline-sulfatase
MRRRFFLQSMGAVPFSLAATKLSAGMLPAADTQNESTRSICEEFQKRKLNIVIIMTDQQRPPLFLPQQWVQDHLPSFERLKRNGMEFTHAFTNTCQCTPSRSTFLTSKYPAETGVTTTFSAPGAPFVTLETPNNPLAGAKTLPGNILNLARVLEGTGYDVVYKGKWHESRPVNYTGKSSAYWSERDIEHLANIWGFHDWNPPDAGNSLTDVTTLGGGYAQNDRRFIHSKKFTENELTIPTQHGKTLGWGEGALEFLEKRKKEDGPFCLMLNLVNPHDIVVYPSYAEQGGYDIPKILKSSELQQFGVPETFAEDMTSKPKVQRTLRNHFNDTQPLKSQKDQNGYVQFYAYLQQQVDRLIMEVLDTIEKKRWLDEQTLIIRLADHGEMGLAHGGMRGKEYNAYEETIRIPMIFSSKALWPKGTSTDAFAGLLDILPTLSELVGAPENFQTAYRGKSLCTILENPNESVQQAIHFTYDDVFLPELQTPSHIRTIRTRDYKYSVYFTPVYTPAGGRFEYELYHLSSDPTKQSQEVHNLAYSKSLTPELRNIWTKLHGDLSRMMKQLGTTPDTIDWPTAQEAQMYGKFNGSLLGIAAGASDKFTQV